MSLWTALSVGRSAINASQMAVEITGHNIANAATEGYSRQRVHLDSNSPHAIGQDLLTGTGVSVTAIEAFVDEALNARIRSATSGLGEAEVRQTYLVRCETIFNELAEGSLSAAIGEFFNAAQDLQIDPANSGIRAVFVQRSLNLSEAFNRIQGRLTDTRDKIEARITTSVNEVNGLAREVGDLNLRIAAQERGGQGARANDLRDQLNRLLERLSGQVEIRTVDDGTGMTTVLIGNDILVQRDRVYELAVQNTSGDGAVQSQVVFAGNGDTVALRSGDLAALVDTRDQVVNGLISDLDLLAATFTNEVNRVHSVGRGLEPLTAVQAGEAVADADAALNQAGLHFTPVHGHIDLAVIRQDTGTETTTSISIDLDGLGADTTLNDLAAALDAVDGVSASVDTRNRLVIEAESDSVGFAFTADTSGVLAALGVNTLFTGHDSLSMGVAEPILQHHGRVAASLTGEPGDGSNLAAIVGLRTQGMDALDGLSASEYLQTTTTTLAVQSSAAQDAHMTADTFRSALWAERESLAGVNLDEEAMQLIRYQRTFQAAARLIQTADELLRMLMEL